MSDIERLTSLVKLHGIGRADAHDVTRRIHASIDQGTEARERKAAEDGLHVACKPGCNSCCSQMVMVWLPEAEVVAAHLEQPENAEARAAFLEAYPAWRRGTGDDDRQVADLTVAGKVTEHVEALFAHWRKHVMCAFNRDGLCTIYPVRPTACRLGHALDTAEYCTGEEEAQARVAGLRFPPLDGYVGPASELSQAMHNALGGARDRTVALCEAVHELLTRPAAKP